MSRKNSCHNCLFYSDNGSGEGWCDFWNRMVDDTDICEHYEAFEEEVEADREEAEAEEEIEEIEYW
jgi:hypothetical protein